jgi:hypothetical protein
LDSKVGNKERGGSGRLRRRQGDKGDWGGRPEGLRPQLRWSLKDTQRENGRLKARNVVGIELCSTWHGLKASVKCASSVFLNLTTEARNSSPIFAVPQALYALFESASGYGLFEVTELDEVNRNVEAVQESILDLQRFGKIVKLTAFRPFTSASNALEQINAVSEGGL